MRLRTLLIALGALLALAVIAAVAFVATFDANRYKPDLVDLVRKGTGRALSIDGELSLALLPHVGLSVGPARLSGPDGRGEFAQFDSARIGVAFWPLLSRRVVVDRLMLDGLALEVVRHRDGSTNLDDLLRAGGAAADVKPAPADVPVGAVAAAVTIAGLQLRNATIGWRDEAAGTEWRLLQADLETGRLASGKPGSARLSGRLIGKRPLVDVAIELSTGYTVDFATRATRLSGFDLKARGRASAAPALDARLRGNAEADPASGRFDLADLELTARSGDGVDVKVDAPALSIPEGGASGQPVRARVRVDRDGWKIDATLSVSAPTRAQDVIVFDHVKADATVAGPQRPAEGVALSLSGDASVDPTRETATLAVRGLADGSAVQAKLIATRFAPLALRYELQADRIDLDRYRAAPAGPAGPAGPAADAAVAPAASRTAPDASGGTGDGAPTGDAQAGAIAAPAALAGADTAGSVRIGTLKVAGVDAGNVAATIASGNGRVEIERLTGSLFGGVLDASATLGEAGRHALRLQLTGADAGMALRELAGRDVLDGRGNLSLDVTGDGRTLAALERSLDGTAALALRDGALKGVDLAEVLRRVRQALAAARGSGAAIERSTGGSDTTAFSSLEASFVIRDGVARNDDLDLRSPLLRVGGAGRIDLSQRSVDFLARVSVVGTPAGQGGADLAALRSVTVPVELKGPFASMSYRVDVAGLAIDTARQALTRKLQEKLLGKPDAGATETSKPISPRDLLEGLLRR